MDNIWSKLHQISTFFFNFDPKMSQNLKMQKFLNSSKNYFDFNVLHATEAYYCLCTWSHCRAVKKNLCHLSRSVSER